MRLIVVMRGSKFLRQLEIKYNHDMLTFWTVGRAERIWPGFQEACDKPCTKSLEIESGIPNSVCHKHWLAYDHKSRQWDWLHFHYLILGKGWHRVLFICRYCLVMKSFKPSNAFEIIDSICSFTEPFTRH